MSYPTPQLNDELVRGLRSDDLIIRKEDDKRILENTFVNFREHSALRHGYGVPYDQRISIIGLNLRYDI